MKRISLTVLIVTLSFFAKSQTDTLVTVNNYKVSVIITEITAREVIYRLPNKPDMPLLHYARFDLAEIILKDGSIISSKYKGVNPFDKKEIIKGKTILYYTPTKLFINQLGFGIERVFKNNYLGIKIPFSIACLDPIKMAEQKKGFNSNFDKNRLWSTGIEINLYPFRMENIKYSFGVGAQYAKFIYLQSYYENGYFIEESNFGKHYSFIINNGFIYQVGHHFIMSSSFGVGIQTELTDLDDFESYYYNLRLNANINIGYKF